MYNKAEATQLFFNNQMGLGRTYQNLLNNNPQGVTLESIRNSNFLTSLDAQYLQTLNQEFAKIDKNNDEKITQQEFTDMISTMSTKGFTYEQLLTMSNQMGISETQKKLLDDVVANLNKVDLNHDGKISESEINNFMTNKEIKDKKEEYSEITASTFSIFYDGSDEADETEAT